MKNTKTTKTTTATKPAAAKQTTCVHCGRNNHRTGAAANCRNLQACYSRLFNAAA